MTNPGHLSEPVSMVEQQIARDVAKFIKEKTGKGPSVTQVQLANNLVVCYFHGFLTKAEELIAESGHPEKVTEYRSKYVNQCIGEIEEILHRTIKRRIKHFFPSWRPHENLACWTIFLD